MSNVTSNTANKTVSPIQAMKFTVQDVFPECGGDEFSTKPISVLGFKHNAPNPMSVMVPTRNELFVFNNELLRDMVIFHRNGGFGMYLSGETGCGKSESVRQYCSRLGIGLTFAVASRTTETMDLIGSMGLEAGNTVYKKGPLLTAMMHGFWFLLDEVDLLDPGVATSLNLILDGGGYLIPETNEYVKCHPGFRFVVTGNTFGQGDSDSYVGTQRLNMAFIDRFFRVKVDYPSDAVELGILQTLAPELEDWHSSIMMFTEALRNLRREDSTFGIVISTRSIIQWVNCTKAYKDFNIGRQDPFKLALDRTILFGASETDINTATEFFRNKFYSGLQPLEND